VSLSFDYLLQGLIISSILALIVWRLRFLELSGAFGAVIIGTIVFGIKNQYVSGLDRWIFVIPLLFFFFSSIALSFIRNDRKRSAMKYAEKDGPRDFWQVLANGGLPALIILTGFSVNPEFYDIDRIVYVQFAFGAALSVAIADTWATEIGTLSPESPRRLFDLKKLEPGQSGGITILGIVVSFIAGLFIPASAWLYHCSAFPERFDFIYGLKYFWIFGLTGLLGSLIDSILGAHFQAVYECSVCRSTVETRTHCGQNTVHISGFKFINNDLVNFLSQVFALPIIYLITTIVW